MFVSMWKKKEELEQGWSTPFHCYLANRQHPCKKIQIKKKLYLNLCSEKWLKSNCSLASNLITVLLPILHNFLSDNLVSFKVL